MVHGMKKVGIAFVVVLILLTLGAIGTVGVKAFMRGYQKSRSAPADMGTRPWTDQVTLAKLITIDVPYPLKPQALPIDEESKALIAESVHYSYEGKVIAIVAGFASYKEEVEIDLNAGAEAGVADLGARPGFKVEGSKKGETSVLGNPAVEIHAEGAMRGLPFDYRGLYFTSYGRFFQLVFLAPKDDAEATASWRRMRDSIRVEKPAAKVAPVEAGKLGLPPGMKPRGAVKE